MVEIFDKMMSKEFDDKMLLSEAYAAIEGKKPEWILIDNDCTIKEYCHRICDRLESEGKDLDSIDVDVIRQEFISLQFTIDYPREYESLLKILKKAKKLTRKVTITSD